MYPVPAGLLNFFSKIHSYVLGSGVLKLITANPWLTINKGRGFPVDNGTVCCLVFLKNEICTFSRSLLG